MPPAPALPAAATAGANSELSPQLMSLQPGAVTIVALGRASLAAENAVV